MASLTIDLNDLQDVNYGLGALNEAKARLEPAQDDDDGLADLLRHEIAGLLDTKTGRTLLVPFVRNVPADEGRTIEEIAELLPDNPLGIDRQRKAHSLIAGLGRWETPRNIRIFEALGGKPGRYRIRRDVWTILNELINGR